ncbi:MAG TPA: MFS transporter [Propioniciclava tarda]|nr:MFS transporter [Propioniciclava tarda]HQA32161.1 MFS transporter [Propioniciclava tarda]HQD61919.1 MFS transporter [Propioniciclava tarda]
MPREIWVLIAAAFIVALGYGLIAPILPQYAKSFDVGVGAASTIVSVFALARLVFAPAGGSLVGRLGERWVYLTGLVIVALSTAACAAASSFPMLLIVRGLGGIGSTMFTISAMGLIVRTAPAHLRGRVSALYGTAFLVGNIAGPVLGTLASGLGFRIPFLIYAGALLAAATVAGVFLSRTSLADVRPDARPKLTFAEAVRHPAYRALLAGSFANGWTNFGVRISLVPLFAALVPTLGPAMAGLGLSAYAVGNFAVLQVSGRLVDRRGRRPVAIAGLVVSGLVGLVFGFAESIPLYLALSALAGAGASLIAPSQQAALADVVGQERSGGPALAAFQMMGDLGGFAGPIVAGLIADRFGFGAAFAVSGVLTLAAVIPWLLAPETLDRS